MCWISDISDENFVPDVYFPKFSVFVYCFFRDIKLKDVVHYGATDSRFLRRVSYIEKLSIEPNLLTVEFPLKPRYNERI